MPESRDRLSRPVDHAAEFIARRASNASVVLEDTETVPDLTGTPIRQATTAMTPVTRGRTALGTTRGSGFGRGGFRTPLTGRRRVMFGSPATGREDTPRTARGTGRARPRGSLLPSWYPRVPLQDITLVVRAIERRRARLGIADGQQIESPVPRGERIRDPSVLESGAPLEHDLSLISPRSAVGVRPRTPAVGVKLRTPAVGIKPRTPSVGKVPKILLGVAKQNTGASEFLTPQKKLLNSIDTVEKQVMEELQKLKRTPSAKKVEREKRVRTLMTMR